MADIQFKKLNVHRQHYKKELVHDDSLIHGINYVEKMTGLAKIKEIDGNSWVVHSSKKIHEGGFFSITDFLSKIVHYAFLIFCATVTVSIVIVIVKCVLSYRRRKIDDSYEEFLKNFRKYRNNHDGLIAENKV